MGEPETQPGNRGPNVTTPLRALLQQGLEHHASDVHLKEGRPPAFRIDGSLRFTNRPELLHTDLDAFLHEILIDEDYAAFSETGDSDSAYTAEGLGRFRVNCYRQRGRTAIVMRHVKSKIPSFQELNLPEAPFMRIADMARGLVLMTGTTNTGKSTTLAAILDRINETREGHIVTLEDPIEYVHRDKKCSISQREVGIDTKTFATGLRAMLREDPNVILIGEMRDVETFETCLSAAESGQLVFSTLHTSNVMATLNRILDWFPPDEHEQIRSGLAIHLRAVVCQRLLAWASGKGRVPAVEIMFNNPGIAKLIHDGEIELLPTAIAAGEDDGMQTFNMSLAKLVKQKLVTQAAAEIASDNPEELKMFLQGIVISQARGRILRRDH